MVFVVVVAVTTIFYIVFTPIEIEIEMCEHTREATFFIVVVHVFVKKRKIVMCFFGYFQFIYQIQMKRYKRNNCTKNEN